MFREGQQIGVYTLVGRIGKGGFGEVWLAEKRSQFVTKRVAVKLPLEEQVNFDAIRQEATLWESASGHPNVLPIIDADVYDGQVVIVSEYASGGSLYDRIKRETKLPVKEAVEIVIGILNGLEFLHSRRIIHRDIKPQNILLQGNTPRLADFGISRAMNTTIVSSVIIGTDAYMSPESFDGKRNVQTDIWSVGVVLYQLLKGSLPFPQEYPSERMFAIFTKEFAPLGEEIPLHLRRIVEKALAKLPENRFQTCSEMRDELLKAHVPLAHPTLAQTEVFRVPVEQKTVKEMVTKAENAGEKETVVNQIPKPISPLTEIPKPISPPTEPITAQPSDSIATQFRQIPNATTKPTFAVNLLNNSASSADTRKRNLMIVFIGITAIIALFGSLVIGVASLYFLTPKYPPYLQNRIAKLKKKYPYFVYTDRVAFEDNKKWGYKDRDGKIIIPAKYESAGYFNEGFADVKLGGKWGFIDENDKIVVPIKYDEAYYFSENLAAVELNKKVGFVDTNGNEVIPFKYDSAGYGFSEGLCGVMVNGKYGFIDRKGNEVISFKYDSALFFRDSLAPVKMGDKWGFIDKTGNIIIAFKYEDTSIFSEDLVWVKINGKYGFIDKTDKQIIPFKYGDGGSLNQFDDGLAIVCSDKAFAGNCGMIDKTDKVVVPLKYDYLWRFSEDLAAVLKNDKWGFVDKSGVEVIPLKYDKVKKDFEDNYAEVEYNGRRLRIDKKGNETDIGAGEPKNTNVSNATPATNTSPSNTYNSNSAMNSYNSNSTPAMNTATNYGNKPANSYSNYPSNAANYNSYSNKPANSYNTNYSNRPMNTYSNSNMSNRSSNSYPRNK